MKTARFIVDKTLCGDCSFALRKFIKGMDGVDAVDIENETISVAFDESAIDEERISDIAKTSIEKLGYRLKE